VVRIKHLLLVEGLTLAGARRKLEEDSTPVAADVPVIDELIGRHARERLTEVKRGLRAILDLLSGSVRANELQPMARPLAASASRRPMVAREKAPARGKAASRRPPPRHK